MSIQEFRRVLSLLGRQAGQTSAGRFQPVNQVGACPVVVQGGGQAPRFTVGPLGGQAGERDGPEGHEVAAVHEVLLSGS
ncbi:hypothetical protein [Streptomyces sp. A0592]|uniref:hypothetical protein n=1 Tax=Streptomyces sp. A0592 TaxID=2563099 RepID=UPI001F10EF8D|nr:hypothetical protein [Streptomyces sp. A0592]